MDRLLDPKNDWAFKQVFGQEKNKDLLIKFLNDMLVGVQPKITDLKFLKVETDSEIARLRQSIVDVLCEADNGSKFIVEMQKASDTNFLKRAVSYASRVYLNQRVVQKEGELKTSGYEGMHPVIFIAIMDKTLFPKKDRYISHHKVQDILSGECDIEEMSFTFLELSKMNKDYNHLESDIERWCYFFKNAESISPENLEKIFSEDKVFKKAYMTLQRAAYSPEQLLEYERYVLKEDEIKTQIKDAIEKGEKIGIEKGEKIGIEKGEKIGIEKEKIAIAKKMLSDGMSVNLVAKYSGLTVEEIEKLD